MRSKLRLLLGVLLLAVGIANLSVAPVDAYTRPVVVRASSTVHWVYNCHSTPTVEITLKNASGSKDVWIHNDTGYTLIARGVSFNSATVYDGLYRPGYFMQTSVFLTAAGVGPYDEDSRVAESFTPSPSCTEYNDMPYVPPSPPPGSVDPGFAWLEHDAND